MEGVDFVGFVFLFWVVTASKLLQSARGVSARKISGVPVLNFCGQQDFHRNGLPATGIPIGKEL